MLAKKENATAKEYINFIREHFEKIIKSSIESGRYASASEVIRAGWRLVDQPEQKSGCFEKQLKLERIADMLKTLIL